MYFPITINSIDVSLPNGSEWNGKNIPFQVSFAESDYKWLRFMERGQRLVKLVNEGGKRGSSISSQHTVKCDLKKIVKFFFAVRRAGCTELCDL